MKWNLTAAVLAMAVISGCGSSEPADSPSGPPAGQVQEAAAQPAPPPPPPPPPPAAEAQPAPQAPAAQPNVVRRKAEYGVGKKGRGYGPGIITTPVAAYFGARERLEFLKVEHAINLYGATHEGPPKSHEEFMKEIIEANFIDLPQLRSGHRYMYDPKKGELMVEQQR